MQPPYVISPENRYQFRDSGLPRDTLSAELLRRAPPHLNEGGFACMICSWGQLASDDWSAAPRAWLEGMGCDALIFRLDTKDVLTYASAWINPASPAFEDDLRRWLDFYSESGIEGVTIAVMILRRRTGKPNWVATDEMTEGVSEPTTPHLLRIFEARDLLQEAPTDDRLLAERFRPVRDHQLEQRLVYEDGRYVVQGMKLQLTQGLPLWGTIDEVSFRLLARCDGRRTLAEAIADLADAVGVDPSELVPPALELVRKLLSLGFLERVVAVDDPSVGS